MNCPICQKTGLSDYRIEPTVCPQCNSDLKGYAIIHEATITRKKTIKKQRIIFLSTSIFLLLIILGLVYMPFQSSFQSESLIHVQDSLNLMKAQLSQKNDELQDIKAQTSAVNEIQIHYVVKSGDNLSKIAFFFYGDWEMYKEIEAVNNLIPRSKIFPNDTLLITLKAD
ncbi:MAG: LysM peptidoglycan-binding domain-containing protein [Bacteroidetes bacterium]|nr:LysM peptidoglycan-binding domain-containing protein [Bacteroidota bacterium]